MDLLKYTLYSLLIIFMGCTKPPDYPIEPVIEFARLNKSTFPQNDPSETIDITFSFTDGDGDLGYNDNGEPHIFLIDSRDGSDFLTFNHSPIPDQGVGNGISGEITCHLDMSLICCIDFDTGENCDEVSIEADTLSFGLYMKDRAGNISNTINTSAIILLCQ